MLASAVASLGSATRGAMRNGAMRAGPPPRDVRDVNADATACAAGRARRPHIVTLMADDLGYADLGYAGSPLIRTPHLDALAASAVHLDQFRAPTWCAPSRASFLTGRHGWELGLASAHGWTLIANHTLLLSELLRSLNYHTAIVGKFHFNPEGGRLHRSGGRFGWGFDEQYGFTGGMSDYYNHHKSWSRNGERVSEQGYATDLFAAEAARIIDEHGTSRPNRSLFLWYSPNAPHTPMQAPAAWLDRFDSTLSPVVRTYAAMVGCMDDGFGRAVAALRRQRMEADTLLTFLSDNGGPLIPAACNGVLRGGKGTPYEGGVRVPAFFRWPACLGGARATTPAVAHMVDLFHTFALAAASDLPAAQRQRLATRLRRKAPHSESLWPALREAAAAASASAGLAAGGLAAVGAARKALEGEAVARMRRRQLVLQASASSSGVLRGRWKLVLAGRRCLALPDGLNHTASMTGFKADKYLLWNAIDLDRRNASAPNASAERMRAARRAGVKLQLYDVIADPREARDLLAPERGGGDAAATRLVGAMLGHYLAAVRVGRRSLARAREEKRIPKGIGSHGFEMTVWFCHQVQLSFQPRAWEFTSRELTCCAHANQPCANTEVRGGPGAKTRLPKFTTKEEWRRERERAMRFAYEPPAEAGAGA